MTEQELYKIKYPIGEFKNPEIITEELISSNVPDSFWHQLGHWLHLF